MQEIIPEQEKPIKILKIYCQQNTIVRQKSPKQYQIQKEEEKECNFLLSKTSY